MGKQTKKSGSNFGGEWTIEKLEIIKKYLSFYVKALKNIKCEKIYIDAFAGSGITKLKDGSELDGSAMISLEFNFDRYYFIELDKERINTLKNTIRERYPEKESKISIINGDCNKELISLLKSFNKYQRGVMFLDPYAMELDWEVLKMANATGILDVWYLFPINAVIRQMPQEGVIGDKVKSKLNKILGSNKWEEALYYKNPQINFFDEEQIVRHNFDKLIEYVIDELKNVFSYVSPKSRLLKNSNNSPMFLLCFAMSNNSNKAINLGSRVVNDIIDNISKGVKNE